MCIYTRFINLVNSQTTLVYIRKQLVNRLANFQFYIKYCRSEEFDRNSSVLNNVDNFRINTDNLKKNTEGEIGDYETYI